MADYLNHDLILHILVFQSILLLIMVANRLTLRRARRHPSPSWYPLVSILIPARNEQGNIARCIRSLLAQDYPFFEILVLDDQSQDKTLSILKAMARSQPGLKVIRGKPPPQGRFGKSWACSQLAHYAKGDLFLFTDADTVHQPWMLKVMVSSLEGERADLVSGFPRQETHSWGERLLVPFFSWALLSFNPLVLSYQLKIPALAVAVGQVMLLSREAYGAVDSHDQLCFSMVEDLTLARHIQSRDFRWRVVHVSDLVSCHMYPNTREAVNGFTKNLFAAFDFRLLPFLFVFVWLVILFGYPLLILALIATGLAPQARLLETALDVGLACLLWLLAYGEIRVPLWLAFLYPVTILSNSLVAIRSIHSSISGRLSWKGRALPRTRWKWL